MGIDEIIVQICLKENLLMERQIGEGSFKIVYLAKMHDSTQIALKIIKDPFPNLRTKREVEAILKCNHNNIGKLFKFDMISLAGLNIEYIIEEYFGGGSLADLLKSRRLTTPEVYFIGEKLIEVLHYLHKKNLVHRDIKPDNIMFTIGSSEPTLVDFGIVRDLMASSLTQTWGLRGPGTPYFASPEQLNNAKYQINWRSDQFSLGVVLCIGLLGIHPFKKDSEADYDPEIVERVAKGEKANTNVIKKLRQLGFESIEKMLAASPAERFRYPTDLLNHWKKQEI